MHLWSKFLQWKEKLGRGPILSRSLEREERLRVLGAQSRDLAPGVGRSHGRLPLDGARTLKSASCVPVERAKLQKGALLETCPARRLRPECLLRPRRPRPGSCAEGGDGWTGRDEDGRALRGAEGGPPALFKAQCSLSPSLLPQTPPPTSFHLLPLRNMETLSFLV